MSTKTATTRLLPLPPRLLRASHQHPHRATQTRPFITLPNLPTFPSASEPLTLTATRRLPYPHTRLYDIIADIDSYAGFLPYCQTSRVTQWTTPPSSSPSNNNNNTNGPAPTHNRRWPARADLTAGWGGFQETYTSRVFCVPRLGVVEAISGDARSEIPGEELRREGLVDPGPGSGNSSSGGSGGVFKSLVTRWTVVPAGGADGWSDVRLSIRYQFANPVYAAVSAAVADKVAPVMVEAFVQQAERILGKTGRDVEVGR